ncbi:MAG: ribokinase [Dehalococcoidia bacterium]
MEQGTDKGKIVVLGGLNMDLMIETPRLAGPGETTEGTRFYTAPGGKGGNQAVAAARLAGIPGKVAMIGRVGGDAFGSEMRDFLEAQGIDTGFLRVDETVASGIAAIFIDSTGQNYVNAVYGTNARCDEQQVTDAETALQDASVLLVQQEIPLDVTMAAMQTAQRFGAIVILDPAPARVVPDGFLESVDILTPNQTEAEALTGIVVNDGTSAAKAAKKIRDMGLKSVIVTLGEGGAHVESDGISELLPAFNVPVVATVAAGDAFNGGLAVGLASGMNITDAARLGMAAGALCVSRDGAQEAMPYRTEAEELLAKGATI